jgi:hypothetical protein
MPPFSSVADRVKTASTVAVLREPAFLLLDRIQHVDPADQVRALALTFAVYMEVLGLDPAEEYERAKRMLADAEAPYTYHVQAIRDFVEQEVARRPR